MVVNRATRLRLRRGWRHRQQQLEDSSLAFDEQFQKNFIGRFRRLAQVKRFTIVWISFILLFIGLSSFQTLGLAGLYQVEKPAYGGTYNEGILGTYSTANPIYATGAVDVAVSKLLFAGLFTYDNTNKLVGDLATNYTVDERGKVYTVSLKQDLTWHDGAPLTADDVVYTFQLIQNPEVKSPFLESWRGIQIAKVDAHTVTFTLNDTLSAFPYSLTTGILPKHIVSRISPEEFRSDSFNTTNPVGAGPFKWNGLQLGPPSDTGSTSAIIALTAFEHYNRGAPMLRQFIIHTYDQPSQLLHAFNSHEVIAMAGLKDAPTSLDNDPSVHDYSFQTTAQQYVFFKTDNGVLSDVEVRKALVRGMSQKDIIARLGKHLKPVREPFLSDSFAYQAGYAQPLSNPAEAKRILTADGWMPGKDGIRTKGGVRLSFQLYAEQTTDNQTIVSLLKSQWKQIGVEVIPVLQQSSDIQTSIQIRGYDALLYGISIGPDPDVYAYWHSSQADPRSATRLNFSDYKSSTADNSLEAGRTRLDQVNRTLKYTPFLRAWQADAPAAGLYQPRLEYFTRGPVAGLEEHILNTDADRYNSVYKWSVTTARFTED